MSYAAESWAAWAAVCAATLASSVVVDQQERPTAEEQMRALNALADSRRGQPPKKHPVSPT